MYGVNAKELPEIADLGYSTWAATTQRCVRLSWSRLNTPHGLIRAAGCRPPDTRRKVCTFVGSKGHYFDNEPNM